MDAKAQEILDSYQNDVKRWRERGGQYKDIQPLTINDVIFMKAVIHPTARKASKEFTERLVIFLCEKKIATAEEIYTELKMSDNPVLKRLGLFQQFGLVRRERKKYYIATPRLEELRKRYLKRICD